MNQESPVQSSLFHTYFERRFHELKAYFAGLVKEYEAVLNGQIRDPREVRRIAREYAAIAANREASELFPYDVSPRAAKLNALAESLDQQVSAESSYQTDEIRHTENPWRTEVHTDPGFAHVDEAKEKAMIIETSPDVFGVPLTTSDDILYSPLSFLSEQGKLNWMGQSEMPETMREINTTSDIAMNDGENSFIAWGIMLEWAEEAEKLDLLVRNAGVSAENEDQFAE